MVFHALCCDFVNDLTLGMFFLGLIQILPTLIDRLIVCCFTSSAK